MFKSIRQAALAAALAAGTLATATTVEARDRYDRGDDTAAWAIGAGIVGLAIGAAIASNNDDDRYYRDRRYYRSYPRGYYNDGYYDNRYYNNGYYYNRDRGAYRNDRFRRQWRDARRGYGWNGSDRRRWRD